MKALFLGVIAVSCCLSATAQEDVMLGKSEKQVRAKLSGTTRTASNKSFTNTPVLEKKNAKFDQKYYFDVPTEGARVNIYVVTFKDSLYRKAYLRDLIYKHGWTQLNPRLYRKTNPDTKETMYGYYSEYYNESNTPAIIFQFDVNAPVKK